MCDFICQAEFMMYQGYSIPNKIFFVRVDYDYQLCIKLNHSSLTAFTYDDIMYNLQAPVNPFLAGREPDKVYEIDLHEMDKFFLLDKLVLEVLNPFIVGTMDLATYNFLNNYLDHMKYLGPELMGDKIHMLTTDPKVLDICKVAAEKMFIRRQDDV